VCPFFISVSGTRRSTLFWGGEGPTVVIRSFERSGKEVLSEVKIAFIIAQKGIM